MQFLLSISILLFLFISPILISYAAAARNQDAPQGLVRSSCIHASYPNLCLRTLSSYVGPANTPKDLAQAAVKVSLSRARRVSKFLTNQQGSRSGSGGKTRQRVALSDCVEQITDSVDELSNTLDELQHLRVETFRFQLSNAETWASAALTYDDTCLDGFDFDGINGNLKADVKRKITNVARVTSNALYMINRLDESRGRPRLKP
ncbi:21 kDa protein-like [Quillaja saponaria]|uniref:21 kDa protein-like n=1 Tax=Quillaja saponaria TaxID=32244 RepID=A0AAD7QCX3_QUISA|nr:21 kDa protein-like [Quillaja saponaria]